MGRFQAMIERRLLVVFLMLTVAVVWGQRTTNNSGDDKEPRKLPLFRPLRRIIRNFINERQAFITIVFQRADIMPKMRWFRQVEPKTLPNAEIPDMINIDGDPRYRVRMLSSHDVTAVTLIIKPLEVTSYPVKFVTCFSYNDEPFQYQLDTIIVEPEEKKVEVLNGIIWLSAPRRDDSFNPELLIHCVVRMESESSRFTDELNAYRTYVDRKRLKNGTVGRQELMSSGCGKIHRDREDYAEEGGRYISQGRRVERKPGSRVDVLYEVSFKVLNGSSDDVGVYTCAGEREKDRTYISSWVIPAHSSQYPIMFFLPCEDSVTAHRQSFNSLRDTLTYEVRLTEGRTTCVRCRVYDRKVNKIRVTRNNEIVRRSDSIQLDDHLNVADGGLSELTLTFLNPTARTGNNVNGHYRCSTLDSTSAVEFHIKVDRATSRTG